MGGGREGPDRTTPVGSSVNTRSWRQKRPVVQGFAANGEEYDDATIRKIAGQNALDLLGRVIG